jgi:hypothetical protein
VKLGYVTALAAAGAYGVDVDPSADFANPDEMTQ